MAGYLLWEGASRLDGAPIVAIATMASNNTKTGNMVQTWILRRDVSPIEAVKRGLDASICGSCAHRGAGNGSGRSCYVKYWQAPEAVWRAYKRGRYGRPDQLRGVFADRSVRLGAYGDPAAVPLHVWRAVLEGARRWTGYSHQWRRFPAYRSVLMASADGLADHVEARARGWRTFRTLAPDEAPTAGEVQCPASEEAGKVTTCERCGLCDGTKHGRHGAGVRSVAIVVHGSPVHLANYRRRLVALTVRASA